MAKPRPPTAVPPTEPAAAVIGLRGVRQNNLRGFDLEVPLGKLVVVTGVSGSGKSSLAFDTLYAEGQRRYVECLSSYARQFLERMDKPRVDEITGILPSVGLRQGKTIRAARATVATLTELGEYFRLVFAHAAIPDCPRCGRTVARTPLSVMADELLTQATGRKLAITFEVPVVSLSAAQATLSGLAAAGYHRAFEGGKTEPLADILTEDRVGESVHVLQDRMVAREDDRSRLVDSLHQALRRGGRTVSAWVEGADPQKFHALRPISTVRQGGTGAFVHLRASTALRCASCDLDIPDPSPHLFSFNSAVGACPACNGFGRLADIDLGRVVPDPRKSLRNGAIKPWSTESTVEERADLEAVCLREGIPLDAAWQDLTDAQRQRIIDGDPGRKVSRFWGIRGWFRWLETKTYKMHVRVLLARYRAYVPCPDCHGARLRPEARAWRWGGLSLPEWLGLPVREVRHKLDDLAPATAELLALELPLRELRKRIEFLDEVGLEYLSLERAARTLSGGELQRVQLVAALATGMTQVLYVLDEPSVGLHPRDNDRLLRILERLRAAGNTVVVVEHDPALMLAADTIIDLGPGAGEAGGELLYVGPPAGLGKAERSLTADYLLGKRRVDAEPDTWALQRLTGRTTAGKPLKPKIKQTGWLRVLAPTARNLKGEDVALRLGALNVVCGVSGSGKSTLVEEVLFRTLQRRRGEMVDEPGACAGLEGDEGLREVVLVDQELPHGSTRANCATFLKVWDAIRDRLAAETLAQARGYNAATFSFNREGGRCPVCEGLGVETVEMQFLSDVRITCEACEGKRFRSDVLQVKHRGKNAAGFLDLTAAGVAEAFADDPALSDAMRALCDLGMGYLRLGQPLSTLSGGEAQRLKIAWHLLQAKTHNALFLLDEPSTGLHLHDVHVLLHNLRALTDRGNTVVLVEHHLDLIAAADHVVELGPDGGPGGGRVLYMGEPQGLAELLDSPTGTHLRIARKRSQDTASWVYARAGGLPDDDRIERDPGLVQVRGARVHNLRSISLDIPRDQFVVVTGLSGSGKSSLAFDVVFAEGQRRFLDCLSPFARQYLPPAAQPDVDRLAGLPPTVAIAQRTTRGGLRSTVATLTDLYPYLRLLYARCGTQLCPHCGGPVSGQTAADVADAITHRYGQGTVYVMAPAIRGRKGHHKEILDRAKGLGHTWIQVDGSLVPLHGVPPLRRHTVHDLDYVVARVDGKRQGPERQTVLAQAVDAALGLGDGTVLVRTADTVAATWSLRRHCNRCDRGVEPPDPRLFTFTSPAGWCPTCHGTGVRETTLLGDEVDGLAPLGKGEALLPVKAKKVKKDKKKRERPGDGRSTEAMAKAGMPDGGEKVAEEAVRLLQPCPACEGSRLKKEARSVQIAQRGIDEAVALGPQELVQWLQGVTWSARDAQVAQPIVDELASRCRFLVEVGLEYLSLGRGATTLSGGESQRIRLAAQLSSNLRGVLYVLDEPTIGLHPADNTKLLHALDQLVHRGNGLLVVEHDEETIRRADHVIELGPGGGTQGGQVLTQGTLQAMLADPLSPTGAALRDGHLRRVRSVPRTIDADTPFVTLRGARRNNLQGITAQFARGRFNAVTGVSGSGKSTLVRDLLVVAGNQHVTVTGLRPAEDRPHIPGLDALEGLDGLGRVVEVDQAPIGRTPRSCPATYMGIFDAIRNKFAALPDAKVLGLTAPKFSFNVEGGRCESCLGAGQVKVEMSFLPTVFVPCESCNGSRYGEQVLQVRYRGATMADVLRMSVADAAEHFRGVRQIEGALQLAERVGLGYLTLGQGSNTLSGGEAQRLKIVSELSKKRRQETLYVLDEPSTGLHLRDLQKLLSVLHELVDRGDTLVVIEHQLDVVREADWIVDLGPGAGVLGGRLCYQGPVNGFVLGELQVPTAVALRRAW
ncbi:MAG: excinuclease ABC subunit UvrA [Myxococcota bacterium]